MDKFFIVVVTLPSNSRGFRRMTGFSSQLTVRSLSARCLLDSPSLFDSKQMFVALSEVGIFEEYVANPYPAFADNRAKEKLAVP
jgi:hypothetical protein